MVTDIKDKDYKMEKLIALLLLSNNAVAAPHYKSKHCYSNDSEFRPNIIKIEIVGKKEYLYSLYIKDEKVEVGGYYTPYLNSSFSTIESVYEEEIKCPGGI